MKHCIIGNHEADESEFGPSKRHCGGLLSSCRACTNARYSAKYRNRHNNDKAKRNRDTFQVRAFQAMYKAARLGGKSGPEAFVSAICGSSDDIFDTLPDGSVDRWLKER